MDVRRTGQFGLPADPDFERWLAAQAKARIGILPIVAGNLAVPWKPR